MKVLKEHDEKHTIHCHSYLPVQQQLKQHHSYVFSIALHFAVDQRNPFQLTDQSDLLYCLLYQWLHLDYFVPKKCIKYQISILIFIIIYQQFSKVIFIKVIQNIYIILNRVRTSTAYTNFIWLAPTFKKNFTLLIMKML